MKHFTNRNIVSFFKVLPFGVQWRKKIIWWMILAIGTIAGQVGGTVYAQQPDYSRLRIYTDDDGLRKLAGTGITIDHGKLRKGVYFESDFSRHEINKIRSAGLKYDVLIDNVSRYYAEQNSQKATAALAPVSSASCTSGAKKDYPVPVNFSLGSMGGYFTYPEFLAHLDTMAAKYSNIISVRQPIDTFKSIEGRPIYWLRISDNPNVDENEPELLYTAIHHAREPGALSQQIFYMYYLLENYGKDSLVTALVNRTEMYFVPMVNPDGYIYNHQTNPNGGGLWRKNRRNNGGGTMGVDLNRNYGYKWGIDDSGSSPDGTSDTYRGTAGFSEPETKAIKYFTEQHNFRIALNYHTYGNLLIYPWGYENNIYTPDSAIFVNYASLATRHNNFKFGTGNQTVGYVANGDSDDWMYGEQTSKPKILSMTPEAGAANFGFWPPQSVIIDLCKDNMTQNLTVAQLVLNYAKATDNSPMYFSSLNSTIPYSIERLGLDTPAAFTVSYTPVSSNIVAISGPKTFTSLSLFEQKNDSMQISFNPAIQNGAQVVYLVSVDNGLYKSTDTISKTFGLTTIAFADNGSTMSKWTSVNWGVTTSDYFSAPSSISDSPTGEYSNNSTTTITLNNPVNLTGGAMQATLHYRAKWDIEQGYDYVQLLASVDSGLTWTALCGKYTKPGSADQLSGEPLYDGQQSTWVLEEVSLNTYIGKKILLQFRLKSDGFVTGDGFYFDDLAVEKIDSSSTPINEQYEMDFISSPMPNPATDYTYLNFHSVLNQQNFMLVIFNAIGQKVKTINVTGTYGNIRISTGDMVPGVYYIQFVSGNDKLNDVKRKKLIVVK